MEELSAQERQFELEYHPQGVEGDCILKHVIPLKLNKFKYGIFVALSIVLLGIPFLIKFWYPQLQRYFYYTFSSLPQSDYIFIINYDQLVSYAEKKEESLYTGEKDELITYFFHRYIKYQIKEGKVEAIQYNFHKKLKQIVSAENQTGHTDLQAQKLNNTYGPGAMIIKRPPILTLLFRQVFRPLYVFIILSLLSWIHIQYYIFCVVVGVTSIASIIINLVQLTETNNRVFQMAYYEAKINVLRENRVKKVSSLELVPGDIAFLKDPIKIPFEAVVIEADALINESVLTGESVPVVKKGDLFEKYKNLSLEIDKNSLVYEGTLIIQANCQKKMAKFQKYRAEYGMPVCISRTNFYTTKGQLIRVILYPKQYENEFQRESYKFLTFLLVLALLTYLGLTIKLIKIVPISDLLTHIFDLITITVPPSLPISMTIGIMYAVQKLRKKNIFCISPNKIINGGLVNCVCFDKTGTLTEDYMDFRELIPARGQIFMESLLNQKNSVLHIEEQSKHLFQCFGNMAANHSLIWREDTHELLGDSMEIKLFQFSKLKLIPFSDNPDIIFSFTSEYNFKGSIYRRFQFDSDVQRMSVISQINNKFYAFCKGSPEILYTIMNKQSIPTNYQQILKEYTSSGYRVLAIASKQVSSNFKDITRQKAEENLQFNGFQIFQNKLKKQSKDSIIQLKQANIYPVMITGDNPLTGSSIGYKCGIISKFDKTVIIDWVDGKFKEEDFVLQEKFVSNQQIDLHYIQRKNQLKIKEKQQHSLQIQPKLVKQQQQYNENEEYMLYLFEKSENEQINYTLTGSAFKKLFKCEQNQKNQSLTFAESSLISKVHVYARAKPSQKAKIVMMYQRMKKIVAMCGDGANDCAALKQADIGLSLSMAQASISAPFTSKVTNISSMVELLKESRAGFATNFSLFNIMALYSLIQYTSSALAQFYFVYHADWYFVYWDVFCNFIFILTIGYTGTQQKLSKQIPKSSLFSISNMVPLIIMFLIQFLGQILVLFAIAGPFSQDINYYQNGGDEVNMQKYVDKGRFSLISPECNSLFLYSNHQYIVSLVAFSISKPWRKDFHTNKPFLICLIVVELYNILLCIVPAVRYSGFTLDFMTSTKLNYFILFAALATAAVIYIVHKLILQPFFFFIDELKAKQQTAQQRKQFIQTWQMQCNFR